MSTLSQASDLIYKHSALWESVWHECKGLDENQLNKKLDESTWSILEIIEHCILVEEFNTENFKDTLDNPKPASALAKIKPAIIKLAMKLPLKVKVPVKRVVPTGKDSLDSLQAREAQIMSAWNGLIDSMDDNTVQNLSFDHPIFGSLDFCGTISFVHEHLKRHLGQIKERRQAVAAQNLNTQTSPSAAANL